MSKIHFIDLADLLAEYDILDSYVRREYGQSMSDRPRVKREAVELHIRAILDERIFNIFRQLNDNWEQAFLDILFENNLHQDHYGRLINSAKFDTFRDATNKIVRRVAESNDPNFTIWEVSVLDTLTYAQIECLGDYRIEQWHNEHGIAKLAINDNVTLDASHFKGYVERVCNYTSSPSNIRDINGRMISKRMVYDSIITKFIEYMLRNEATPMWKSIMEKLTLLCDNSLIDDATVVFDSIKTYFEYEVQTQIDKVSSNRSIGSFIVYNSEIIINFGTTRTFNTKSFAKLEQQIADANGDYIPERQRYNRG